jgi:hypothetical protein
MLGISSVVAQLAPSQEGVSSMSEWVDETVGNIKIVCTIKEIQACTKPKHFLSGKVHFASE